MALPGPVTGHVGGQRGLAHAPLGIRNHHDGHDALLVARQARMLLRPPAAMAAAQGAITKLGLLVVRGHVMETLAKATDLVIDKTGTLTTGHPELKAILSLRTGYTEQQVLAIAAAMERARQLRAGGG